MKQVREVVSIIFDAPMRDMTYVEYFGYINTGGKITARSLLDLATVLFTFVEEQEKINAKNQAFIDSLQPKAPEEKPQNVDLTAKETQKLSRAEILAKARAAKKAKKTPSDVL